MTDHQHDKVRSRNEAFSEKVASKICFEEPSAKNPYIAQSVSWYGYDVQDLMQNASVVDVFYLMFRGELPSTSERQLLEKLMIAFMNPGPRHPATRAAMNVGVGKTDISNILPISSAVMGGQYLGGGRIEDAMRYFRKHGRKKPEELVKSIQSISASEPASDSYPIPGFGHYYGGIDVFAQSIVDTLLPLTNDGSALAWGNELAKILGKTEAGWMMPGVAAAVFSDLGFHPRSGAGLFQLICAPGMLAHGLELANKPITAMPYVSDDQYFIDDMANS